MKSARTRIKSATDSLRGSGTARLISSLHGVLQGGGERLGREMQGQGGGGWSRKEGRWGRLGRKRPGGMCTMFRYTN